jgi:hypothetical protein
LAEKNLRTRKASNGIGCIIRIGTKYNSIGLALFRYPLAFPIRSEEKKIMYCPSCGTSVNPGLSYCNRCGAELIAKDRGPGKLSETLPESLVWAIVSITVGGLAILIGLMAVMKNVLNFGTELILALTLLSFLMLIATDGVLIWLLVRSRSSARQEGEKPLLNRQTNKALGVSQAGALPEHAPSVTEHTTRTLEPAETDWKKDE